MLKLTAMSKLFLFLLTITPLVVSAGSWANNCPKAPSCEDVGKIAYSSVGKRFLKELPIGEILGVTWQPKGSVIDSGDTVSTATKGGWYFIIGPGVASETPIIRHVNKIKVK